MRWHYGLVAFVGLAVGWSSVNFGRYLVALASPVKVQPLKISLGEVVEGNEVSFTVQIVNNTNQTLKLVRFSASTCGCFFEQQKLPQTVLPRTKMPITFGLRTEYLPDKFQEQLTFVLTDPFGKTFTPTVTITGKLLREIIVEPSFIDFGTVVLGKVTTQVISLQNPSGQSFAIEGIEASSEIEVSLPTITGREAKIQVSFRPKELPGWREGKIKKKSFCLSRLSLKESLTLTPTSSISVWFSQNKLKG